MLKKPLIWFILLVMVHTFNAYRKYSTNYCTGMYLPLRM